MWPCYSYVKRGQPLASFLAHDKQEECVCGEGTENNNNNKTTNQAVTFNPWSKPVLQGCYPLPRGAARASKSLLRVKQLRGSSSDIQPLGVSLPKTCLLFPPFQAPEVHLTRGFCCEKRLIILPGHQTGERA